MSALEAPVTPDEGMGPNETVSYVYYDDDNKEIPPEAEGSVLMAINASEQAANTGEPTELQPYHEDPAEFEAKRLAAMAWLESYTAPKAEPSAAPVANEPDASENEEEEEEEEEGEEEEGMGDRGFSREATAEDEVWVLERILRRRVDKNHPNREHQYLCKWKYYVEPTWEGRELLEDEGFLGAVNEFDGIKVEQTGGTQRHKGSRQHSSQFGGRNNGCSIENRSVLEDIFSFDLPKEVCKLYSDAGIAPLYIMSVAAPERVKAFINKWKSLSATHRPTILFHGTQSRNIIPIVRNGLMVPGASGVKVANGSLYGVGIYTAIGPSVSAGYCNNRHPSAQPYSDQFYGEMFVCIGLVSNSDPDNICVANGGNYIVFFEASLVIPLWLVGFKRVGFEPISKHTGPLPRRNFNSCFDEGVMLGLGGASSNPKNKWDAQSQQRAVQAGITIPSDYRGRPMTKRMLREAPRMLKDLYKAGALIPLKGNGQK